jgi:transposase
MAGKLINMNVIKQIIRLSLNGETKQGISNTLKVSRNTVKKYLHLIRVNGWHPDALFQMDDMQLETLFTVPDEPYPKRYNNLEELFPTYEKELERTGVNRWVLWGEYKQKYPEGYSYSQFCYHFQQYFKYKKVTMHFEHVAGDKLYIDFTGKKLSIVDRQTGELKETEVFVATLGCSQLTYVEALPSQKKVYFINATQNALHYFGGVPRVLVCDNLKAGVTKASRYEADLNEDYLAMANHYSIAILPTRSAKPRDKALVEKHVSFVYSRIFAPLRDRVFYSIEELSEVIRELLEKLNNEPFQGRDYSRREHFEAKERQTLSSLPSDRYEIKEYAYATVLKISHVQLSRDKHYYSVPYRYIGDKVTLAYTHLSVSIYYKNERIAFHRRNFKKHGYTSVKEHLPSQHQFIAEWNSEKFIHWAMTIDPVVEVFIKKVLESKVYPEQAYRSCVGILSFDKKIGRERLVNACKRAIHFNTYNYKIIERIIQSKHDLLPLEDATPVQQTLPLHENIRGASYYENQN